MNYTHNPKSGKFASKQKNYYKTVHWSVGLLIISGVVLVAVALGSHDAGADKITNVETITIEQLRPRTILTSEELAQVKAQQELVLKQAEASKQKKLLEEQLKNVETELSVIRKESLGFQ